MTKLADLEKQVEQLTQLLAAHGIQEPSPVPSPEDSPDYIPHGSDAHAAFLGLVEVDGDEDDYVILKSAKTGRVWRLLDEIEAMRHFPGIDPQKAAMSLLRQKVGELDTAPGPPPDAPGLWRP